jgi:hypothetical protein
VFSKNESVSIREIRAEKGLKRAANNRPACPTNNRPAYPTNNRAEKGLKTTSAFANLKIGFCQSRNWHVPTDKKTIYKKE